MRNKLKNLTAITLALALGLAVVGVVARLRRHLRLLLRKHRLRLLHHSPPRGHPLKHSWRLLRLRLR